ALQPLDEARERFQTLAEGGNPNAARMASVSLAEIGDCLLTLGRLDEAAQAYEAAIELAEARDDQRSTAVSKGQLGTIRILQKRYDAALSAWIDSRETFEQLGEPGSVATAWHQIGVVHQEAGQYEAAEHAYQRSLGIKVQRGDRSGEAMTLDQLGLLYQAMERREEAVRFHRQAATIRTEIQDLAAEGRSRNNVAIVLIQLGRHDEAREELERAIECREPYGHAVEPWKTFFLLHALERAVGNGKAATAARQRALDAFLAYRRAGGENHNSDGRLAAAVHHALTSNTTDEIAAQLAELREHPNLPTYRRPLIPALQAILAGSRDSALAEDPALHYTDAAEITLLLEALSSS
ncbi:MAG: tetratricopeptide repeat protein, partial [Acidobacteriota bacterium]